MHFAVYETRTKVYQRYSDLSDAHVGSLTTRQCYYKGIYIINPDYCLYICIYDVHITHIWTYSAYRIMSIQQNMVLCNSLNMTCILSLYLFLHVFNKIDTTGITLRSKWTQPVYVYMCLQIFEITLMRRAGSRTLCHSDQGTLCTLTLYTLCTLNTDTVFSVNIVL